jgi:hypothetical protein
MVFAAAFAIFAVGAAGMVLVIRNFRDTEPVMEPTLRPGDALITVPASGLRRGDIVLARVRFSHGTSSWSGRGGWRPCG